MDPEDLKFWMEEFPELDEEDIVDIIMAMNAPGQPSLEDRKQRAIDIEDYTKYW